MKFLIAVLFIAFIGSTKSQSQEEVTKKFLQECAVAHGVGPEVIQGLSKKVLPTDENGKLFLLCYFKKIGFVTPSNDIDLEFIKRNTPKTIKQEDLLAGISACDSLDAPNKIDVFFLKLQCSFDRGLSFF